VLGAADGCEEQRGPGVVIEPDGTKLRLAMRNVSIAISVAFAGCLLAPFFGPSARGQQPPAEFAAQANITVENNSPVPQIVAGTNVPPFELPPHQQTMLAMSAPPPVPGSGVPTRFHYSIGQAMGPVCRGTIDMSVMASGTIAASNEATHCFARSLGTGGANCNIAVSARDRACEGGLAFAAP
jgi:hypothetical protein